MAEQLNPFECILLRAVTDLTAVDGPEGASDVPIHQEAKRMQGGRRVGRATLNRGLNHLEEMGLLISWMASDPAPKKWWGAKSPRFYRVVTSSQRRVPKASPA